MERKRVAGRFVAEDEGAKKRVGVAAPRAKSCRTYTRRRVAEVLPEIVHRFSEEAKKGSIQHAKVLMKLGGLDQRDLPQKPKRRGKSLLGLLLEDLKKGREQPPAEESGGEAEQEEAAKLAGGDLPSHPSR
jgi:hypothetical protein